MAKLTEYNRKRRFSETPEPTGGARPRSAAAGALSFVVQKHAARRLHYDFRLELDGVLKSWAVPEGPSLDPSVRRLAVETEDHPLDYGGFEGTIPKGNYGAGAVIVWDRGIWVAKDADPARALDEGALKFRLAGEKLSGGFMLKRLPDKGRRPDPGAKHSWLLIKERDPSVLTDDIRELWPASVLSGRTIEEVAADADGAAAPSGAKPRPASRKPGSGSKAAAAIGRKAAMPRTMRPMLPTAADLPPAGDGWIHELKHDGYRTLAFVEDGAVRMITRNGLDWTDRYAALAAHLAALPVETAVIDGEVIVQDERGASSFELLQQALSEKRDDRLVFYAFDIVYWDGRDLAALPLVERKALLRGLLPAASEGTPLQYGDHLETDGRAFFAEVCRMGLEGIVSKQRDARYSEGRSKLWLKAKRHDLGTFRVVGYVTRDRQTHVASLLLAEEDGGLRFVGRAGSGLTEQTSRELFERLAADRTGTPAVAAPKMPDAAWVEPRLSAEIAHRGRTAAGILRQPAVVRVFEPATRRDTAREEHAMRKRERLVTDADLAAIHLTNPDREMFKGSGVSKLDLALYYARIGDWMLPDLRDRPVTLIRCPSGEAADCFYQKHAFAGLPDGVDEFKKRDDEPYLSIRTPRGYLALIQFGVVEFHPTDCKIDNLARPDRFIVDLDPGDGVAWSGLQSAALQLRERLEALGLTPFVRTTGGKGLHVVVPLVRRQGWDLVKRFMQALTRRVAADAPDRFINVATKAKRRGKIFLDVGRTSLGASAVASYSLRARPNFPAATPLAWEELSNARETPEFDRLSVVDRVEKHKSDPWEGYEDARATITRQARRDVGLDDD